MLQRDQDGREEMRIKALTGPAAVPRNLRRAVDAQILLELIDHMPGRRVVALYLLLQLSVLLGKRLGTNRASSLGMNISPDQIAQLVELYRAGQSIYDIGRALGCAPQTVSKKLIAAGEPRRDKGAATAACRTQEPERWSRIHTVREDAFVEITTPEQAYWLGFLSADGTIRDDGVVELALQLGDQSHVERFRTFIGSDAPLKVYRKGASAHSRDSCKVAVCSRKLANTLALHGITPRKSLVLEWNRSLDPSLYQHYIRGYFDGDGGWCFSQKPPQAQFQIVGVESFLLELQQLLMSELGYGPVKLKETKVAALKILGYGGTCQVVRFANYIYQDAEVYLDRKLHALLDFLKLTDHLRTTYASDIETLTSLL